jgi:hypothetical protein
MCGLFVVRWPDLGVDMDHLEILIDKLLLYVPTDLPFLASLMMRAEGRYIIFCFAVVVALLLLWLLLLLLQMMFASNQRKSANDKPTPVELSGTIDAPAADKTKSPGRWVGGGRRRWRAEGNRAGDAGGAAVV